jgi:hypothetical protein
MFPDILNAVEVLAKPVYLKHQALQIQIEDKLDG